MAFNIDGFIDTLGRHGTLQTNKFVVTINDRVMPSTIGGTLFGNMKQYNNASSFDQQSFYDGYLLHSLRAESFKLPGVNIDTYDTRRYGVGPPIRSGTNVRLDPFSVSFIIDKDYNLYKFFYGWLNTVFNFSRSIEGNQRAMFLTEYKERYATEVFVSVYENDGSKKCTYEFMEAFPVSLSEPSLSWRDSNSLYKFDVTFSYTSWQIDNKPE